MAKKIFLTIFVIFLFVVIYAFITFPRPELPEDTTQEDLCAQYGIRFDATSIETIYHDPESILQNADQFRA
jgi:hypothetical protein